ncbi:hypothetical protein AMK59_812 [Oryctes borbonicus]|uniref:Uncharacterized protein n=1 Tax=Oryctes borbonicus TaxID=1629725 RepID=A0A0T6BB84_9SCAR|nr:hypothetical protein AMK59_812 [Oryctes borbonicus]
MNARLDSNALCDINILTNHSFVEQERGSMGGALLAKKCLFGPSNTEEIERMLDEEFCSQHNRFVERFGIDIESVEKKFANKKELKKLVIKVSSNNPKKKVDAPLRGVLKPYNKQLKVTDFLKIKKATTPATKDISEKH